MRNKQGVQLHKSAKRIASLALCCALLLTCLPTAFAAETALGTDSPQVRNLQVTRDTGTYDAGAYGAVDANDPMYWMGQGMATPAVATVGDQNAAKVWFGNYWQADTTTKTPVLWRTLSSGGGANWQGRPEPYPGRVTLITECIQNAIKFDETTVHWQDESYDWNQYWYNRAGGTSSDLRAWLNGVNTGGMVTDNVDSRKGKGSLTGLKEPYYTAAFDDRERSMIVPTLINMEQGIGWGGAYGNNGVPSSVTDKVFVLSYSDCFAYFNPSPADDYYFGVNGYSRTFITPNVRNSSFLVSSASGASPSVSQAYPSWTRTPSEIGPKEQVRTSDNGDWNSTRVIDRNMVRPAINLDPQGVMFVAASDQGYAPGVSPTLTATSGGQSIKFTTSYPGTYRVFTRGGTPGGLVGIYRKPDTTKLQVTCSVVPPGDNYLGVLVVNTATRQKYVGRVAQVGGSEASVEVSLPAGVTSDMGGYKVFAWLENETNKAVSSVVGGDLYSPPPEPPPPTITGQIQDPAGWAQAKNIGASVTDGGAGTNGLNRVFYSTDLNAVDGTRMQDTGNNWYVGGNLTVPGQYYIIAYNNIGKRTSVPITVDNIDRAAPSIADQGQAPAGWATEKSIGANVWDTESGLNRVFYSTDPNAATGTAMTHQDGNWYTALGLTVPGTYYIIAYDNAGNRSAVPVVVDHIDRTPPTVGSTAADPPGWSNTESFTLTAAGLADDPGGSGVAGAEYSLDSTFTAGVTEMTLDAGAATATATVTPQEGETTYYIRAKDVAGNAGEAKSVVTKRDLTAPDVSNIFFDDQSTGMTRVTFLAEDVPKEGLSSSSGMKRVQWKAGADGTYADAVVDTSYADDLHYFFNVSTADTDATEYYIRAEDNAANTNEVRALDQKGTISVNAPAKMLFAVYPNTFDKQFYSPQYEVANLSETVRTKVSVVGFQETGNTDGSPNAFGLVSQGTALPENDDHIVLYMQPGGTPGAFRNFGRYNLLPDVLDEVHGLTLGTLEKKTPTGGANEQGKYTFDGDVPHYDLTKLRSTTLRAGFGMTLKFEKDNTVA